MIEIASFDSGMPQAVLDCAAGKAGVVFLAAEALLLGSRHDFPVFDQRSRRVVVESGNTEDAHSGRRPLARLPVLPDETAGALLSFALSHPGFQVLAQML